MHSRERLLVTAKENVTGRFSFCTMGHKNVPLYFLDYSFRVS